MHCDLSRYRNTSYTPTNCSLLFLRGLRGQYKDIGTTYVSMILAHHQSSGDGSVLPKHLHILTLAQMLADTAYGGMSRAIPSGARACRINSDNIPVPQTVDMCATHAQGFIAMKAKLHQTPTGTNRGRGPPKQAPDAALSDRRRKAVPRRSHYQGTCGACD